MTVNPSVKENILKCALELFSAKGYEAVSVQELVNAAGITKPTLYYYFGSKEGLYEQLIAGYYGMLEQMAAFAGQYLPNPSSYFDDVHLVLTRLASKYFEFARENELFYRMVLSNLFMPDSSPVYHIVKKYHFRQYEVVHGMFKSFSAVHTNMQGKETIFAWTFLGMINSFIGLYYNNFDSASLEEDLAMRVVKQFMHGIHS